MAAPEADGETIPRLDATRPAVGGSITTQSFSAMTMVVPAPLLITMEPTAPTRLRIQETAQVEHQTTLYAKTCKSLLKI